MTGRRTARGFVAGAALILALVPPAFAAETDHAWIRGIFTGRSPRPVSSLGEHDRRNARTLDDRQGDSLVLLGAGRSMQPLYPAGTLLVLQPADCDSLQSGQTVIYRNRAGRLVAHVLITRARDGWRARGLNNRLHDLEPIVPANLLGVVVAAYSPAVDRPLFGPREFRATFFLADE